MASDAKSREFKLTRERIALKPVSFQMCGPVSDTVGPSEASGKLAYVRVATFNKQTTENAKAAFRQLKAEGASRYALGKTLKTKWPSECLKLTTLSKTAESWCFLAILCNGASPPDDAISD